MASKKPWPITQLTGQLIMKKLLSLCQIPALKDITGIFNLDSWTLHLHSEILFKIYRKMLFHQSLGPFIIHRSRYFKYAWTVLCAACVLRYSLHQRTRHARATEISCCAMSVHTTLKSPCRVCSCILHCEQFQLKHTRWSRMLPFSCSVAVASYDEPRWKFLTEPRNIQAVMWENSKQTLFMAE